MPADRCEPPEPKSIWRNTEGRVREVGDADEDGYWVSYYRPPPAPADRTIVTGCAWAKWVETTGARRIG